MSSSTGTLRGRILSGLVALLLATATLALLGTAPARADTQPIPPSATNPVTASADGLPTTQIDGVGWSQAIIGNTVYVGGAFTSARPAGAPAGTGETPRSSLLAYDIRTGELNATFDPVVNGQVLAVTASPDGSRIYIGGDFTSVDGQTRNRVAAIDAVTGELVAGWAPSVSSQVRAIAATTGTVYLGGSITAVGGVSRSRLAAVTAANGTLLPWAPVPGVGPTSGNRDGNTATSDQVLALVVTSGGTQVVAAGRFDSMNGAKNTGVAALDGVSGATRPYAINQLLTNQGINSAVYSLTTDGNVVIGTGYDFSGPGNLEGSFTVAADSGRVLAINDCHGDHYGTYISGGVVYIAGHAHDCSNIGGFQEQSPRVNKYATAITLAPSGTVGPFTLRSDAFYGKPAPRVLDWFPTMNGGTVTGQTQAGWSVTGNGQYLAYAGEFPRVNGVAQAGLVRYALPGTPSPNRIGPAFSALFTASVDSLSPGTARITWRATSDQDNENLVYRVQRDTAATVIHTVNQSSTWADRILMTFTDTAAQPTSQYRITATDPFGNVSFTDWTPISATPAPPARSYVDAVLEDGATELWSFGEPAGATSADGQRHLAGMQFGPGVTAGAPGALAGDSDTAFSFDGTPAGAMVLTFDPGLGFRVPVPFPGPETSTSEMWFRTDSTQPSELFGFGSSPSGNSAFTDRTVVLDAAGRLTYSVNVGGGTIRTISGTQSVNDGAWHYLAAQLSPAGMFLYVDGALVASRVDTPPNLNVNAYVRVGGDAGTYFDGDLDELAFYGTAPDADMLATHYSLGAGAAATSPPTARFTATQTGPGVTFDGAASSDGDGVVQDYSWDFGDGTSGTGSPSTHAYGTPGIYSVVLTVTDDDGRSDALAQLVTVNPANFAPSASFTPTPAGRAVSVNSAGSVDSDGTITSYAWNWGDGTTPGSGATATHLYGADGPFTITLTVTDNQGATGTTTRQVTVAAGPVVLADDAFARTVSGGLGTAPVGGPWTAWIGNTRQSVASGTATFGLAAAGNVTGSYLGGVSQTTTDVRTTFSLSTAPTGSGTYVYVTGRRVSATLEYRVRVRLLANGTVGLALSRLSGGAEGFPGGETIVPGLTLTAGQPVNVRVLTSGAAPTQVQAWVWRGGTTEPTTAAITRSDATAGLQVPGAVGLTVHRPTGTTAVTDVRFTSFRVTGAGGGTAPPNAAPTASFTATPTGLQVAVDAAATTDDGTIASYAWNWGDSTPVTTTTTATATHTYAAGTYTITLTVTDNGGLTGTTTRPVTVAATPPPNVAPTASFTATPTGLQVAVNGTASTDDGSIATYSWNWGDTTAATTGPSATATHTYAAGTYTITLTVTDNLGLPGSTTRSVTVPPVTGPAPIVNDPFDRTVASGLGTAPLGGAWTSSAAPTRQSVTPGVAEMRLDAAGQVAGSYLAGVSQTSADIRTTVSLTTAPTGNGTYVYVTGRRVNGQGEYRARLRFLADGRVALALSRLIGTTEAFPGGELILTGLTYTPGTPLNVHVQVTGTGTTTIRATVWTTGTEPATPQMTRTDTTAALQAPGAVGLTVHRPAGTTAVTAVRFGAFTVAPVA